MAERGDMVIVGFSGHGVQIKGKSYFCPEDTRHDKLAETVFPMEDIYDRLQHCKAALKLLVVDACRSDFVPEGAKGIALARGVGDFNGASEKLPEGIFALYSCDSGQFSVEDGEFQHGVFMHYLIEGLQGKAGDETGTVTSLGLANYVSLRTKRYVAQHHNELQTPVLKGEVALFEFNSSMNVRPERPIVPPSEPSAEKTITNSIGMKLVLIPAGEFQMGSSQSENDNEGPQHQVHITKGFYLGKYPVTQGEYERVMGKNPSTFRADGAGKERVSGLDTSRFPVETVSWKDAVEFCRKLSEKEGKRYRLPTEAEWEYACRTRTKLAEQTVDGPEANCNANNPNGTGEKGPYLHRPTTVGSYRANDFEPHDMLGNVQEWCRRLVQFKLFREVACGRSDGACRGLVPRASRRWLVRLCPGLPVGAAVVGTTPTTRPTPSASV